MFKEKKKKKSFLGLKLKRTFSAVLPLQFEVLTHYSMVTLGIWAAVLTADRITVFDQTTCAF